MVDRKGGCMEITERTHRLTRCDIQHYPPSEFPGVESAKTFRRRDGTYSYLFQREGRTLERGGYDGHETAYTALQAAYRIDRSVSRV